MDNVNRLDKMINFNSIRQILQKPKDFNLIVIEYCKNIHYNDILYLFTSENQKTSEFIWLSSAEFFALENYFQIITSMMNLKII